MTIWSDGCTDILSDHVIHDNLLKELANSGLVCHILFLMIGTLNTLDIYKSKLNEQLSDIFVPNEHMLCNNVNSTVHNHDICDLYHN